MRELQRHYASTFDDETEGSRLIECSCLSFDCCQGSCCRFDSSSSRANMSSFRAGNDRVFGENWRVVEGRKEEKQKV